MKKLEKILKEHVQKYLDFACKSIEFDIEEESKKADEPGPKKISLSFYDMQRSLVKANNYIIQEKYWLALIILVPVLEEIFDAIKQQDASYIIENIEQLKDCVEIIKESKSLYSSWLDTDYQEFLDRFKSYNIFSEDDIDSNNVLPNFFISLDDTLEEQLLRSFKYKEGSENSDMSNKNFKLSEQLYITDSLQEFMDYLKRSDRSDDLVYVNMLMKIEKREDMSYFLFSFSYKDHVWLVTDMGFDFKNPMNKETTRNPRRRREKYYETCSLPYGLIDQLDEIRKSSKQLKTIDSSFKMKLHSKDLKDFDPYCKMFIIGLVSHYIKTLENEHSKLLTFEDHLNQKLLTSDKLEIDPNDSEGFTGWDDHIREVSLDIMSTVNVGNELILADHKLVTSNELYDRDWLGTPEQLDTVMKWAVFDSNDKIIQKKLDSIESTKEESIEKLNVLLNAPGNFERLIPYLFSGNDLYYSMDGFVKENDGLHGFWKVKGTVEIKFKYNSGNRWFVKLALGRDPLALKARVEERRNMHKHDRIAANVNYERYIWHPPCHCCNKNRVSKQFYINVEHYNQLMFLCNITDIKKLPKYYRSYRSREFVPYHGNSILDNVHPYAMLSHPSWRHNESGIAIEVLLCKVCSNKLHRKHRVADATVIDHDKNVKSYVTNKNTVSKWFSGD